ASNTAEDSAAQLPRHPSQTNATARDSESLVSSWICVFGSFLLLIPSSGFPQAIGTFQAYSQQSQLSGYASRDIGWISGLYTALTLFLGIQAGLIIDRYSPIILAPIATLLTIPTFFHFILCLGIFDVISGALTSTIALPIVEKLFVRYRGLAIGLALNGAALRGVIIPFILRELFPRCGYKWMIRFMGALIAGIMVPGCLCYLPYMKMYNIHVRNLEENTTEDQSGEPPEKGSGSYAINLDAF
ncbi:unnamed protein product, partial [Clonostachys rhizophaga]